MTRDATKPAETPSDRPAVIRHVDDMQLETIRWPGETGKMLFHPDSD